ncbi:hypothetical protein KCP69_18160 [Salmonella enterica subsp. enterica]|nr:hypothetical protein KCP69_18160 [Salmonella enterica subsp. enterica]
MKTRQEEAVITAGMIRRRTGAKIIDEMFLFEIWWMWTIAVSSVCCRKWIPVALMIARKAEPPLREVPAQLCPQRAADILRDDNLANRGPVLRLSQVENEQKAILLIVRRLAETGSEMVLIGSGEGYLCLMVPWQVWTPTVSPRRETFVCRLRLIT